MAVLGLRLRPVKEGDDIGEMRDHCAHEFTNGLRVGGKTGAALDLAQVDAETLVDHEVSAEEDEGVGFALALFELIAKEGGVCGPDARERGTNGALDARSGGFRVVGYSREQVPEGAHRATRQLARFGGIVPAGLLRGVGEMLRLGVVGRIESLQRDSERAVMIQDERRLERGDGPVDPKVELSPIDEQQVRDVSLRDFGLVLFEACRDHSPRLVREQHLHAFAPVEVRHLDDPRRR
mmetsp:Transcript_8483/g.26460  ORF Transcript_8483/g.26460 Transcript_8483/m.26460 type:complete len:237 (-) Transcript_8483:590-1300(-)